MKKDKKASLNLALSAFLVIAYVICAYFFMNMVSSIENATLSNLLLALIFVVFGLILFYATRTGEGKQIHRFSLSVLLLMVLPGLYIVLAGIAPGLPLSDVVRGNGFFYMLGSIVLGYGLPYCFLSGYEKVVNAEEDEQEEEWTVESYIEDVEAEEGEEEPQDEADSSEDEEPAEESDDAALEEDQPEEEDPDEDSKETSKE